MKYVVVPSVCVGWTDSGVSHVQRAFHIKYQSMTFIDHFPFASVGVTAQGDELTFLDGLFHFEV